MSKLVIAICLSATAALATTGAMAQGRPMTTRMNCGEAQRLVAQRGAVVLGYGQERYDGVVSTPQFCLPGQVLVQMTMPTRDSAACFVGYTCREGDGPDSW